MNLLRSAQANWQGDQRKPGKNKEIIEQKVNLLAHRSIDPWLTPPEMNPCPYPSKRRRTAVLTRYRWAKSCSALTQAKAASEQQGTFGFGRGAESITWLADCDAALVCGTGVVSAFADNEVGRLIEDCILQGGVDMSYVSWRPDDGVGREVRNGLNFTERGFRPPRCDRL